MPDAPHPINVIHPPFSIDQVDSLNAYQCVSTDTPVVCRNWDDGNHVDHRGRGVGLLVATVDGWICPICDHTREWAYASMADWTWRS